ncbi:MAG: M20/M25/M40 family metallo-hydrolase, partial [Rhizobiales bacterium]|nr:M20/M25/M40 family metallo-hydrolase [Hyphomicrobiales bacterium]
MKNWSVSTPSATTIGPQTDGGIVLSGHTDVVPVEGQHWSSDPFTLRVTSDKAYGRGAVDMKAFAAIALSQIDEMLAAPLKRPIHLMFSYDEETTCLGVVD